jgi:hypothetical protein
MPSREYLMAVRESQYGTPVAAPVKGVDLIYPRLSESFTVTADPTIGYIAYGGGRATRAEAFSDTVAVKGQLRTVFYPSQSMLLDWAATPINAARTLPWPTIDPDEVMPPGDLASYSLYHAVQQSNGSYRKTRYTGCKVSDWKLTFGADGEARKGMLDLTIVGQRPVGNTWDGSADPDDTEFPAPLETDYPTGPYLLSHCSTLTGSFKLGTVRTQVSGFTIGAANKLDVRYYTSRFAQLIRFTGREGQLEADARLKASVDDRSAYRALTAQDCELILDAGGTGKIVKIDFHGRNYFSGNARDLPVDKEFSSKVTLANLWDPAQATDLAISRS